MAAQGNGLFFSLSVLSRLAIPCYRASALLALYGELWTMLFTPYGTHCSGHLFWESDVQVDPCRQAFGAIDSILILKIFPFVHSASKSVIRMYD